MRTRFSLARIVGVVVAVSSASLSPHAQQPGERITVPFSDPARPGTVKVRIIRGSVTVKAGDGKDVVVESAGVAGARERSTPPPASSGLRRLTPPRGLSVEEEANVVTVNARLTDRADLQMQVPARTNLQLSIVGGGAIVVDGVQGDIEVSNVNGAVTLTDVAGAVVAHSVNGKVLVNLRQVTPEKPMAFTSLNGVVDVTLPASLKANLRLRSDQGEIYTDFELRSDPAAAAPGAAAGDKNRRSARAAARLTVDNSIYGSVNGGGPDFEIRTFNGDIFVRKGK
jgi:hypothetical protein